MGEAERPDGDAVISQRDSAVVSDGKGDCPFEERGTVPFSQGGAEIIAGLSERRRSGIIQLATTMRHPAQQEEQRHAN